MPCRIIGHFENIDIPGTDPGHFKAALDCCHDLTAMRYSLTNRARHGRDAAPRITKQPRRGDAAGDVHKLVPGTLRVVLSADDHRCRAIAHRTDFEQM